MAQKTLLSSPSPRPPRKGETRALTPIQLPRQPRVQRKGLTPENDRIPLPRQRRVERKGGTRADLPMPLRSPRHKAKTPKMKTTNP
jgi:hypothetical protein